METIIIFTVSFLQIVNDSNDTLFFIQMFPEDFFAKVSEPFLGGGEEWKDQYTEDNKIPSQSTYYIFQYDTMKY